MVLLGALALAGCRAFSTGSPCAVGAGGNGLAALGYRGDQMPLKTVAFVFDGGPSAATAGIADVLQAHGIQGAFFVDGGRVAGFDAELARVKEQGHLVGNRGFSGARLDRVVDPSSDVRKADEAIAPYVSGDVYLLRAPENAFDDGLVARLRGAGLGRYVGPVTADMGTTGAAALTSACEAENRDAAACAQAYTEDVRAKDHGIVLLDGERGLTADVLKALLPKLKSEGFAFVRVDQVATIRQALEGLGAKPGTVGGAAGCQEYGR